MFRATSLFIVMLVLLAITFLGAGNGAGIVTTQGGFTNDAASLEWAKDTAARLETTEIPGRDLYELAERLQGHDPTEFQNVARTTPLGRKVGDTDQFNLSRIEEKEYIKINATVMEVTDHAYWYVAEGFDVDVTALKESAQIFEENIYPTNRQYFGSEWSPGIDGDTRITVLIADIPGVGGYFTSSDEYPTTINPYSNEREMIYIATKPDGTHGRFDFFEGVLAHEFQHMIHWNVHRNRDVWLDEGSAETAMSLNGYDIGSTDLVYLNDPDVQLTTWAEGGDASLPHYGASYLFVRYLLQHYGGADMLKALLNTPGTGVEAVNGALQKRGFSQNLDDVYADWIVANYLNDASVGDGRFANEAVAQQPSLDKRLVRYPSTHNGDISQYGADYISLERGTGDVTISFQGATETGVLPTTPHSGSHYWYSNRRDTADTMLTQEFDLSSVSKATLKFWTWFNIEGDYDYGYVEVSADGGATWQTLKGQYTTDTNPQGANYGNGYSGPSGYGPKGTQDAKWVEEGIDLSSYAGKKVQLHFEMITDEAYNAENWAIDDISIPEIGYSTDAENDDAGWQASGFVRISNTVPQQWHVAAIEYGRNSSDITVQTIELDENGVGTLDVQGLGSQVSQVVLAVGASAPTTTEKSPYKIEVRRKQ